MLQLAWGLGSYLIYFMLAEVLFQEGEFFPQHTNPWQSHFTWHDPPRGVLQGNPRVPASPESTILFLLLSLVQ